MEKMSDDRFYPRPANVSELSEDHKAMIHDLRDAFDNAGAWLEKLPDPRYRSIAITLLEQSAAMATKAITHQDCDKW